MHLTEKKFKVHKAACSRIVKIDLDKRIVIGVVSEPDTIDLQGDIILAEDIEKACHGYMIKSRLVGLQHREKADVDVVECYIAPCNMYLDESETDSLIVKGSWVMATKVNDDRIWDMVKTGKINSYSIGGWGNRTPIDENNIVTDETFGSGPHG